MVRNAQLPLPILSKLSDRMPGLWVSISPYFTSQG